MCQLGEILNRPNLKEHVIEKYKRLLEIYLEYIASINKFFDENCKVPPIPTGFSLVGGGIAWAKMLMFHVEKYMNFFKSVYVVVQDDSNNPINIDGDINTEKRYYPPAGYQTILQEFSKKIKVQTNYSHLMEKLRQYQTNRIAEWKKEI